MPMLTPHTKRVICLAKKYKCGRNTKWGLEKKLLTTKSVDRLRKQMNTVSRIVIKIKEAQQEKVATAPKAVNEPVKEKKIGRPRTYTDNELRKMVKAHRKFLLETKNSKAAL